MKKLQLSRLMLIHSTHHDRVEFSKMYHFQLIKNIYNFTYLKVFILNAGHCTKFLYTDFFSIQDSKISTIGMMCNNVSHLFVCFFFFKLYAILFSS